MMSAENYNISALKYHLERCKKYKKGRVYLIISVKDKLYAVSGLNEDNLLLIPSFSEKILVFWSSAVRGLVKRYPTIQFVDLVEFLQILSN